MVWWIASEADDEQYRGRTASRGVFLWWCAWRGIDPSLLALDEDWNEIFVRFIPHNEGEGFRAIHGHSCRISGSGKTLKVQTLGCVRRSSPY